LHSCTDYEFARYSCKYRLVHWSATDCLAIARNLLNRRMNAYTKCRTRPITPSQVTLHLVMLENRFGAVESTGLVQHCGGRQYFAEFWKYDSFSLATWFIFQPKVKQSVSTSFLFCTGNRC
jgi:hypothetical protein